MALFPFGRTDQIAAFAALAQNEASRKVTGFDRDQAFVGFRRIFG